jgi:hypothetical protein
MRTLKEIDKKLEKDSLLRHRDKTRIFGNIDTDEKLLQEHEIVQLVMSKVFTRDKVEDLFNSPSHFYENINR